MIISPDFKMTSFDGNPLLAEMLQDEHIAGIHDTLAYINEMMDLEGLELHQDGESYPNDYFESLHYDFICRCDGDEWPE